MSINNAFYVDGMAAFAAGDSLREVADSMKAEVGSGPAGEDNALSYALGFGDAFLTAMRATTRPRSVDLTLNINVTGRIDDDAKLSLLQSIEDVVEKAVR